MKKISTVFVLTLGLVLVGCGQKDKPMSDADMATKYNLSLEEYQEQKEAAARMNMSIEDHLNMGHSDDSSEVDHSSMNHTMSDGEVMADSEMKSHQEAADSMGMTLQEHIDAGHVGH